MSETGRLGHAGGACDAGASSDAGDSSDAEALDAYSRTVIEVAERVLPSVASISALPPELAPVAPA